MERLPAFLLRPQASPSSYFLPIFSSSIFSLTG